MRFYKYHNFGNDFIIFDDRDLCIKKEKAFISKICNRHEGIGADGIIFLKNSDKADFSIEIFNSDGSLATSCGNALFCISLFFYKLVDKKKFSIEVDAYTVDAFVEDGIFITFPRPYIIKKDFLVGNDEFFYVDSGVRHLVGFFEDIDRIDVKERGKKVQEKFKDGVNVNFVKKDKGKVFIRTYERGVENETKACGTGALACLESLVDMGAIGFCEEVKICFRGGEYMARVGHGGMVIRGEPKEVFSCEFFG